MSNQEVIKIYHNPACGTSRNTLAGGVSKSMLKKSRVNFDKIEKCK